MRYLVQHGLMIDNGSLVILCIPAVSNKLVQNFSVPNQCTVTYSKYRVYIYISYWAFCCVVSLSVLLVLP